MTQPTDTRPWYREPMLWLVVALPAAVVVAGLLTLSIAIRSGGDDNVRDSVQRVGKGQTFDLGPDRVAAKRGLRAQLQLSEDTEAIELAAQGADFDADRLVLRLSHPTEAREDLSLELVRVDAQRYLGRIEVARDHAWNLQLAPVDGSWRLQGRLARDALDAELSPAVDGG